MSLRWMFTCWRKACDVLSQFRLSLTPVFPLRILLATFTATSTLRAVCWRHECTHFQSSDKLCHTKFVSPSVDSCSGAPHLMKYLHKWGITLLEVASARKWATSIQPVKHHHILVKPTLLELSGMASLIHGVVRSPKYTYLRCKSLFLFGCAKYKSTMQGNLPWQVSDLKWLGEAGGMMLCQGHWDSNITWATLPNVMEGLQSILPSNRKPFIKLCSCILKIYNWKLVNVTVNSMRGHHWPVIGERDNNAEIPQPHPIAQVKLFWL